MFNLLEYMLLEVNRLHRIMGSIFRDPYYSSAGVGEGEMWVTENWSRKSGLSFKANVLFLWTDVAMTQNKISSYLPLTF